MSEIKTIEEKLKNSLSGDNLDNSLDFIAHMTKIGMTPKMEHHPTFYYMDEWICLFDAVDNNFMICSWPGNLDVTENEKFPVDENLKEFAQGFVKKCFNCGGCGDSDSPGPMVKNIFGQEHDNVCCNIFHFWNPDEKQLENGKILMELLTHIIDDEQLS